MCHVLGSCLVGTESWYWKLVQKFTEIFTVAWSPSILKSFSKITCLFYSMCTKLNNVIIRYVLRPIQNAELAVFWLRVVHKHTLEAASPRNISWDTELFDGSTWKVLWAAEAVRVIIWCSILIVKCIMSVSHVVLYAMWPKRRVYWQLQIVHTKTVPLCIWIREQTSLNERACWNS